MKSIKTILRILKKRYPQDFIRDVRINDDETVTFKVVRRDDTWREITEQV
jgi:hypothetical protein